MFIKIQTNRAKLRKVITLFDNYARPTEFLIAPRPLPREIFKLYVAYAFVAENTKNNKLLESIKNNKAISESEFNKEVNLIKCSWVAGEKRMN